MTTQSNSPTLIHDPAFNFGGGVPESVGEIAKILAQRPPKILRSDDRTAWILDKGEMLESPPPPKNLTDAAVLVPLLERKQGLSVLFTRRAANLHHHGGQISFPGGRSEPEDHDAVASALRETWEEVGIPPKQVDVLGHLDDYITISGFRVKPVVGCVNPPFTYETDRFEVAELFEVPLAFILDPSNHRRDYHCMPSGQKRFFYAIPYKNYYIWGATASMLVNLYEVLTNRCES